ncbi:folate-binding protein YgfZ [Klenkia sp. PcliD-1-E]|uniref:CAF17-like 4Fe-4S cluster assembly/insertion protein YgfZ n=1 Tax=Klenkia sp. PcliD-1-E TaxID=2954492 RepID=UPI0020968886|nr:folate-binding protein [Klenkia sp. PcliD-1-E]MCO7220470.1 folate-binding protein [Klenkia sp. PcliD-1-E]
MPSPLLNRPGAVATDGGQVAAHYGDPLPEQRRATEAAVLVDRSDRDVVAVPGPDRLSWLHSLLSQHLEQLADGAGTEALVLSPQGHVEHHVVVAETGGTTWLDTEPGTGADLAGWLDRMRFMLRVEPALVTDDWAVLTLLGPRGDDVLAAAGLPVPTGVTPTDDGGWVRRAPVVGDGVPAVDLLVPRAQLATRADALLAAGASLAGVDAYAALAVEAHRPRVGTDSDHRTIPNETPWLASAVHLEKGCYRGQETVARVHNLGRPPRRLVLVHLDGMEEQLPPPGTPVTAGTREVGRLGTVVRHHELGVVGLALVKSSVLEKEPLPELRAAGSVVAVDPDDLVVATDDTVLAARERVRAVRSATIGR